MSDGHSVIHFANKKDINNDLDKYIDDKFNLHFYEDTSKFIMCPGHVRCSDPYWSKFDKNKKFLFSFLYMPEWIELAVEQFNATFKNIKVVLHRNVSSKEPKHRIPVFEIIYKGGYNKDFQKYTNLLVHHYFRMLSILETDISFETKEILNTEIPPSDLDVMDLIINENNLNPGDRYRKLCEYDISKEDLLRLDSIKLLRHVLKNNLIDLQSTRKQTSILLSLKLAEIILEDKNTENSFNVGDYTKTNELGKKFFNRSIYGIVKRILSNNKVIIKFSGGEKEIYVYLLEPTSQEEYKRVTNPYW